MSTEPKQHGWIWGALIIVALLFAYVGGYFVHCDFSYSGTAVREFSNRWIAYAYLPLGIAVSKWRGETVALQWFDMRKGEPGIHISL
jgi:hypothetical protein